MDKTIITRSSKTYKALRAATGIVWSISSHGPGSGFQMTCRKEDGEFFEIYVPAEVLRILTKDMPKHFENKTNTWGCWHLDPKPATSDNSPTPNLAQSPKATLGDEQQMTQDRQNNPDEYIDPQPDDDARLPDHYGDGVAYHAGQP